MWVLNWICWKQSWCCFNIFGEYTNKVFVWWLSWVFLCGVLACCIAGFVTANRFGFSLYGVQCAYERIYYDSVFGQIKKTYPKWEGLIDISTKYNYLNKITSFIIDNSLDNLQIIEFYYNKEELAQKKCEKSNQFLYPIYKKIADKICESEEVPYISQINGDIYKGISFYTEMTKHLDIIKKQKEIYQKQLKEIHDISNEKVNLAKYKSEFIENFTYYVNVARAMGRVVPIIYFALLLIFVVGAGALLITYFCKRNNQETWIIILMHITWNGIRFFMFSFFIYGCAYGMLFLGARDSIAYLNYAFSEKNLNSNKVIIIPDETKVYFKSCLYTYSNNLESFRKDNSMNEFIKNAVKFDSWINNKPECTNCDNLVNDAYKEMLSNLENNYKIIFTKENKESINNFKDVVNRNGNIYDIFDCRFINNEINLMFRALWDFSWETRILCALSCCIGFFGAIAVYSFLWTMHLWNKNNGYDEGHNKKQKFLPKKKAPRQSNGSGSGSGSGSDSGE
jgi:uncharacterized protein with PIN domain